MKRFQSLWQSVLVALGVTQMALPARAQDDGAPTRAEFAKLQSEVREQRQLIIQMLQTEQQRYDMLLRLMQGQGGGTPVAGLSVPSLGASEAVTEAPTTSSKRSRASSAPAEVEHRSAPVEGKVSIAGGGGGDVYVYVENVKGPPVRNKTIEIRQEGKQFLPRVAVVQAGTNVTFPNFDAVYHNVFSNSPRNSFDLGSYRAGEKPRAVTLASPGVVDVFCNMHQKMSASILVVPSPLFTKVRPDGTYRLENVPVGTRKIVAWGPNAKAVQQRVEVGPSGTQASFTLEHEERGAHANKLGQAYGSYRD